MLVPKPLTGDRIQNTSDAGSLASSSLDGINQLRDESLGVGQSSTSFLQLVRDSQGSGTSKKVPGAQSVFDDIGNPYREVKPTSHNEINQDGLNENFANLSVKRVGGHLTAAGAENSGAKDNRTSATVYGDGSLAVGLTDGHSVNVDASSNQISLSSEAGTYASDGSGNYYFTDKQGNRRLIDQETAQELGAELSDGSLTVGAYRFDGNRLSMADGSSVSVSQGHVHARFKQGDGPKGDVEVEAGPRQSVVSSDSGAQSLVSGDDAFISDGQGGVRYAKLTGNSLDNAEPLGGVPIRDAMMTLFALADGVRGKSVISPEQYSALQAAVAQLNGASVACKDLHNWAELRFVNGISTAVDRFLSHVSPGNEPNNVRPGTHTELTETIAEPTSRGERHDLPGSPTYLPTVRLDGSEGVWAEHRSNEAPVTKVRADNPGMVSDAAISEASKVLPVEKA